MSAPDNAKTGARRRLRIAVVAAALGVAGCFTAAFTFSGGEAQAVEPVQPQNLAAR